MNGTTDTSEHAQTILAYILSELLEGREVTALGVYNATGSLTARSRIPDGKRKGYPICAKYRKFIAQSGRPSRHAVYFLPKEYLAGIKKQQNI